MFSQGSPPDVGPWSFVTCLGPQRDVGPYILKTCSVADPETHTSLSFLSSRSAAWHQAGNHNGATDLQSSDLKLVSFWISTDLYRQVEVSDKYPSEPGSFKKSIRKESKEICITQHVYIMCIYIYIININYITIIVRVYMYIHLHSHAHTPMDVDENKLATCKDASTATTWRGRLPASWDPVGHRS